MPPPPPPTHTHTILITATVVGCDVFPMDPSDLATMHRAPHHFVIVARACGEFSCVTQLRTCFTNLGPFAVHTLLVCCNHQYIMIDLCEEASTVNVHLHLTTLLVLIPSLASIMLQTVYSMSANSCLRDSYIKR